MCIRDSYDLQRYGEAAEAYQQAVTARPPADEPFFKLLLALSKSGERVKAIEALEQRVRQDEHVPLATLVKLADICRAYATEEAPGGELEVALVRARHWYAVIAQEDPVAGAAHDETYRNLTHRLQSRPGAPDAWFQGTYRHWLEQGGWGIPDPFLYLSLEDYRSNPGTTSRLYPGWKLHDQPPPAGSWRHPSVWEEH